ncbi:MAG: FAD-binding oxidoreductase [Actinobacteria bacterium]|nr:FAD-binding oxidoreductase [Actinomycetota bacterium]
MSIEKIAIVGGGIVGTACAYYLAREGKQVTLFEETVIAHGASGRNPGFVWLHTRNPGFGREVSLAGRELYDTLKDELPLDFEFRASGGIIFYTTEEQGEIVREFVSTVQADGYPMEHIDGAEVRRMVQPIRQDVLGASYCPADACINTPLLVRSFAEGARQAGADIREGVAVHSIIQEGDRVVGVETAEGRFEADAVVLGAGAWARKLADTVGIQLGVGGERLQVAATVPVPEIKVEPLVYGPLVTKQYRLFRDLPSWNADHFTEPYEDEANIEVLELMSQRKNGEILMGCAMDYPDEIDLRPTVEGLARSLQSIVQDFPGLRGVAVDRVWAGVLPFTSDTAPIIDEPIPGLFLGSGHVYGNAAGPMTGKLITSLVLGREPEIDLEEVRFDRALEMPGSGVAVRW